MASDPSQSNARRSGPTAESDRRAAWVTPRIADLPRLANLTLQTNGGILGDNGESEPFSFG